MRSARPGTGRSLMQGLPGWTAYADGWSGDDGLGRAHGPDGRPEIEHGRPVNTDRDRHAARRCWTSTSQLTGAPHPAIEQATQAAQQSQQQGGITATEYGAGDPGRAAGAGRAGRRNRVYATRLRCRDSANVPDESVDGRHAADVADASRQSGRRRVGGGFHAPTIVINAGGG